MSLGSYLAGLAVFAAVAGSCGAAAHLAERRWLALSGSPRAVALGVLFTLGLIGVHVAAGMAGILARGTVVVLALILLGIVWAFARRGRRASGPMDGSRGPEDGREEGWWPAVGAAAIVGCFLLASLYVYARGAAPPSNLDALSFHLPGVGTWIQTQHMWPVDQFIPGVPTGEYPQNGDVVMLTAVLPWHAAVFVRLVNYPYLLLLALAVYAASREVGARRPDGVLAAATVLAIPAVYVPVTQAVMADAPLIACFAAGGLFLLRHRRTRATGDLVVAAIALGIALGTKWYGVSAAVVAAAVWLGGSARSWRPADLARRAGLLCVVALLAGGVWMLRNWIAVGNPLYPARVEVAGTTIFGAPPLAIVDRTAYSIAHYATDWSVWRHWLLPAWWHGFSLPGLALAGSAFGVLVAAATAGRRALRRVPGPALACAVAAILLAAAYLVTPGSASGLAGRPGLAEGNTRYGVAALIAAAPAMAWALGSLRRWAPAARIALVVTVAAGVAESPDGQLGRAAAIAVVLAVAAFLLRDVRAGPGLGWVRANAHAAVAAVAVVVAVAGYAAQRSYLSGLYRGIDPVFDGLLAATPPAHDVGIAGRWSTDGYAPVWPAFGPRIENRVAYVGPERDGVVRQYGSSSAFGRALARGGYDLLIVGREGGDRYVGWAEDAGYRRVAASPRLVLLAAREPT